jgi:adenylate cyclase
VENSPSAYLEFEIDGEVRELPLPADCLFRIGRSEKNDLVLADDLASRSHAMFQRAADGVYITDCGSSNGTFVNGVRVSSPMVLRSGDQIRIGHKRLTFREGAPTDPAPIETVNGLQSTNVVFAQSLITVLVVDIRDFTGLAQRVDATRLARITGAFFREAGKLLQERGVWTQKYIGDAVMAVWLHDKDVQSAPELLVAIDAYWRLTQVAAGLQAQFALDAAVRIGAGINTGWASVGNVGGIGSSDYTALGDVVNLAFRLESATKELGCDLAIGRETYDLLASLGATGEFFERFTLKLKGYDEPTTIHAAHLSSVPALLEGLRDKVQ